MRQYEKRLHPPRAGFAVKYEKPMTILHVITTIDRGGAENHLLELIRGQVHRGHSVCVAYLKGGGYWRGTFESLGVAVYPLRLRRYGDPVPVARLIRVIGEVRPGVIHSHMPPADLYTRMALSAADGGIAFVSTKHNDEPFYRGWGNGIVARLVCRRADRVIAISEAVRRYVTGPRMGCHRERTLTIPYGIDTAPFDTLPAESARQAREQWGVGKAEYLIGTIARLAPQKALHVLLQGFAQYLGRGGREAKLVIVGQGPLEQDLRRLNQQLGIAGKVIWAGFREDIPAVLGALDLFALTSRYEGFGLVLLEAMAAAKPVVATRVSAIPEVVVEGETAILVPPDDAGALTEALLFFQDDTQRRLFGNAGKTRAVKDFSLDAMVDRTISLYEAALAELNPVTGTACRR